MSDELEGPDPAEAAALAAERRLLWQEMPETAFQQWRHHPVTAAYLQYIDDQIALFREAAADFVESGQIREGIGQGTVDTNIDALRGQIVMMRQLRALKLEAIQGFYGYAQPDDRHEAQGEQERDA